MNIDLGAIIIAVAAYYAFFGLLFVSLFSLSVWGITKYVKHAGARHREISRSAKGNHNRPNFISPSTTLAS